jgi:hypothetical protein
VPAGRLAAGVFSVLGVQPLLGRVFTAQEENAHQPLAVLSYALWLNRYHRDSRVLGTPIVLDQAQLWVPLSLTPDELSDGHDGYWGYNLIAHLRDGVTVRQAEQDADRVAQQVMRGFPASMSAIRIQGHATLLRENAVANIRPLLRTLFSAVSVVLLIACANVAGCCWSGPSAGAANTRSA